MFLRFPSPVYRTFERYLGSPCPTFLAGKTLTPRIDTSKASLRQMGTPRSSSAFVVTDANEDIGAPGLRRSNQSLARHQLLATRYCRFPLPPRSCTSPITRNFNNYCLTSHKQMGRTERSPRRRPSPSEVSGANALFCEIGAASPREGDRRHGKAES